MKIVRQYEFGGSDVLKIENTDIPSIVAGEVLIKGSYTSVNYADIKGRFGGKSNGSFPITLGLDIAGIIVESRTPNFKKGDRVIAFPKNGSYAEYVVATDSLVYKIPDSLSFEQAAAMPIVSILAYILLSEIGQVKSTDTIVVHSASGGVGSMLIQLAKFFNVKKIIATVGNIEKSEYVKDLGADVVCHYNNFAEIVLEHTEQKGAQVIFDSIAGDVTTNSYQCLANYGTLVQFGNSSGRAGVVSTADVHSSCRSLKGFSLGTTRKSNPERLRLAAETVIKLFANGTLSLTIDSIYNLTEIKQAHDLMESRSHKGKILIKM